MKAITYHLDQKVRGAISKNRINESFLDKYHPEKHEALLPLSVLEYAGINIKEIFLQIPNPENILSLRPLKLEKLKDYFENQIKEKLPKKDIEEKIREKLYYDNDYAKPFIKECMNELSKTYLYDLIVNHLSWDRFSQMKKILASNPNLIAKIITKDSHLYILKHAHYMINSGCDDEDRDLLVNRIMKKVKIKPNTDIGDCELIHVALNGQSSGNLKKKKTVDCYTMDDPKEIKRRLILCNFFYEILKHPPFDYEHNFEYSGAIYILDEKGREKEKITTKDYLPRSVSLKIITKDLDTLFLLNE